MEMTWTDMTMMWQLSLHLKIIIEAPKLFHKIPKK